MNGIHDMGGMTAFGVVPREVDEPVFHAEWEGRVFGLVRHVIDGHYNWDEFRSAIERLDPLVYLSASYYQRWLAALERYAVEKDVIAVSDFRRRLAGWQPAIGTEVATGAVPDAQLMRGDSNATPRFHVGQVVRARLLNPAGHTRLPRYVRGKTGVVERLIGRFVLPDTNSLGLGAQLEPVYAVRFRARDLWGEQASTRDTVCVDLWESYLRPASDALEEEQYERA